MTRDAPMTLSFRPKPGEALPRGSTAQHNHPHSTPHFIST
eukprot:CAMPEP_0174328542 /NCGR_PEP_ID=MMETSP0810-20121108/15209_1 /TAXON_ID=73025 ORGANISM="Eutreptiella gymnastica-like, Strain CCMP1594" /NCGR_SAMPLE_ID=MMETSP0810 /ASSEMBLY_ACC=CAM_ASM_000659 /LENGTH=39 /DNA_ID= /DNA_START= /DNA_END= /DNA_ORIENTATION=